MIQIAILIFIGAVLWGSDSAFIVAFVTAAPMIGYIMYRMVKLEDRVEELEKKVDDLAKIEDSSHG